VSQVKAGFMSQQWTVWCGDCPEWDQLGGPKKGCEKAYKAAGWVNDRHRGWLCPKCAKLSRHNDERIHGDTGARKQQRTLPPLDDASCSENQPE